jgi:hypothetical protein
MPLIKRGSIFLILIAFIAIYHSEAQVLTQTLRGSVKDEITQLPLVGVTVQVYASEKKFGAITDQDGKYRVDNIPIGRVDISFTFIGYDPVSLRQIEVTSTKELVLDIDLLEKVEAKKRDNSTRSKK